LNALLLSEFLTGSLSVNQPSLAVATEGVLPMTDLRDPGSHS
jgi:hypothetical protein